jgi:hypothetical protein
MKGRQIHIALMIISLLGSVYATSAQQLDDSDILNAPMFRERYFLQTDRTLYAAGEPIRFRVYNLSHQLLKENKWSNVLYVEVINSANKAVAQTKFILGEDGSSGELPLPDTISTGEFYLRIYSRWMLNFPPTEYAYVPLAIVNPGQLNLKPTEDGDSASTGFRFPFQDNGSLKEYAVTEGTGLSCEPSSGTYGKRTKVEIGIRTGEFIEFIDGLAVTVVRKEHLEPGGRCFSGNPVQGRTISGAARYAPETRGISFEGKIVRADNGQPVPRALVDFTLLGAEPDYIGMVSDNNGDIQLTIPPNKAARNALVTIEKSSGTAYRLITRDPFSNEFLTNSIPRTQYFSRHLEVIEELMLHTQIKLAFGTSVPQPEIVSDSGSGTYFYGVPEYRYRPAEYIPIPNLGEFLFELVPQVAIRERQGEYLVAVLDDAGFSLDFAPLILLDHVAVKDLDALFKTDPQLIGHVDVINTNYIRGGNYYGGIISIISKEGNLAGVGLPEGATIIDLQTYRESAGRLPQEHAPDTRDQRIPDLRTLLYWNPHEEVPRGSRATLEFLTSDIPGSYVVTVTGMTTSGEILMSSSGFQVE